MGLPVGLARRGLRPLLTQLATPILTSKIGLIEKKSGPELPEFCSLANDNKKIAKKLQKVSGMALRNVAKKN
jgi:hypothetical protein